MCLKKLVRLEYCAKIAAAKELLCRMSDESRLKLEVGWVCGGVAGQAKFAVNHPTKNCGMELSITAPYRESLLL